MRCLRRQQRHWQRGRRTGVCLLLLHSDSIFSGYLPELHFLLRRRVVSFVAKPLWRSFATAAATAAAFYLMKSVQIAGPLHASISRCIFGWIILRYDAFSSVWMCLVYAVILPRNAWKAGWRRRFRLLLTLPRSVNETFQWIQGDGWCFNYLQIYPNIVGESALRELRPHSAHYSEELMWWDETPLFVLPSICGRAGVYARGRPSHSPSILISALMDLRLCFGERQAPVGGPHGTVMVLTRPAFGSGSETGTGPLSGKITQPRRQLTFITFHVTSPSLFHSLPSPPSFRPLSFPAIVVALPRWALRPGAIRCLAGIVILGTWEIKSLLMSDDAPARRSGLPFALIQTSRLPSHGPQGCLCTAVSAWSSHVGVLHKDLVNIQKKKQKSKCTLKQDAHRGPWNSRLFKTDKWKFLQA